METYMTLVLTLLPIILIFFCSLVSSPKPTSKLPPGPKLWPIIGHIHLLGTKPHHSLDKLSKVYGPLMSLKLGSITTIVISSPEIAKEMFTKHDLAFSRRQIPDVARASNHHKFSMIWLPVCPKWRHLRKIVAIQLFTNQRLDATQGLRRKKVDELVEFAKECCGKGQAIDIGKASFTTSLNLLSNTIFSIDLCSYDSSDSSEFKDIFSLFMEMGGSPNVSDLVPWLRPLDLQGLKRKVDGYLVKMLGLLQEIIDERLRDSLEHKNDVLETLLKLEKEKELSLDDVKHMLMDLFVAGTDTSSNTLEWAMTELLCNPEIMAKAKAELNQVVGEEGTVQETDILKLPYIQAIVKETLRLHPPVPFLVPHKAVEDVQLCNYVVPKNAQVLVNIWSIGRDPSIWNNQESFTPERFLEEDIDFKGHDFELLPFGAGRRICPGMPLAYRMVHLMLANLLHSFNWKLSNGVNQKEVEMEERFGIALQKAQPLHATPFLM